MNELSVTPSVSPDATSGRHAPVLLTECLEALAIVPDGVYLDGTFGRGGHSRALLARLGPRGRLLALDRDPAAVAVGEALAREDRRFAIEHCAFSALSSALQKFQIHQVHGALFDLGVSSPQLDEAERGFSFMRDGPLDMRMDPTAGQSASAWLATVDLDTLTGAIKDYGEERFARRISTAIIAARQRAPITRTRELADLVAAHVGTRERGQHPATRTFQALRIVVNRELEELKTMLEQAVHALAPSGRLAVMSFHSLEDRMVKTFFNAQAHPERALAPALQRLPDAAREKFIAPATLALVGKSIVASDAECALNPRARSARLRVASKR